MVSIKSSDKKLLYIIQYDQIDFCFAVHYACSASFAQKEIPLYNGKIPNSKDTGK